VRSLFLTSAGARRDMTLSPCRAYRRVLSRDRAAGPLLGTPKVMMAAAEPSVRLANGHLAEPASKAALTVADMQFNVNEPNP